ncbi:hypothetical protein DCAR_0730100 [Daucus carota subsp. sativus]|uniref:Uncharacterized protein n=1 Tax=Daucus carota subsp. sativus TaxID=79200 RepID=A0A161X993_DAUCS|nr:hypothetical protein DCAR_0730100 [Daucus carota subsp. sativus]
MVKNITPDKRLEFIRSLEFEAEYRSVDPINGYKGLVNQNVEQIEEYKKSIKLLIEQAKHLRSIEHHREKIAAAEEKIRQLENIVVTQFQKIGEIYDDENKPEVKEVAGEDHA